MKKLVPLLCLVALLPLGGCVVYGPGPARNAAWAYYDRGYDRGNRGYDRPVLYGEDPSPNYGEYPPAYRDGEYDPPDDPDNGYYDPYYDYGY
jgi:hypothetical protein